MIKDLIKWKPIIIGIFITLAFYIASDIISGQSLVVPAFLIAGIAVGFMIGEDIKNGVLENRS